MRTSSLVPLRCGSGFNVAVVRTSTFPECNIPHTVKIITHLLYNCCCFDSELQTADKSPLSELLSFPDGCPALSHLTKIRSFTSNSTYLTTPIWTTWSRCCCQQCKDERRDVLHHGIKKRIWWGDAQPLPTSLSRVPFNNNQPVRHKILVTWYGDDTNWRLVYFLIAFNVQDFLACQREVHFCVFFFLGLWLWLNFAYFKVVTDTWKQQHNWKSNLQFIVIITPQLDGFRKHKVVDGWVVIIVLIVGKEVRQERADSGDWSDTKKRCIEWFGIIHCVLRVGEFI